MKDDIKDIINELFKEVGAILGIIAWATGWPRSHGLNVPGIESALRVSVGRLRRLVEDLHVAIK